MKRSCALCSRSTGVVAKTHGHGNYEPRSIWHGSGAAQGRCESACEVLLPIFNQFVEGLDTADLKAAEQLLATLLQQTDTNRR